MPRVPGALVHSSEDDEVDNMNKEYRLGSWIALPLQSMESIPFSDVSHTSYAGSPSSYLNSTSGTSMQNHLHTQSSGMSGDRNEAGGRSLTTPRGNAGQMGSRGQSILSGSGKQPTQPQAIPVTMRGPQPRLNTRSRRTRRPAPLTAEEKATMIALIQQEHVGALQKAESQAASRVATADGAPTSSGPSVSALPPQPSASPANGHTERILPHPGRAPPTRPSARKAAEATDRMAQDGKRPFSSPAVRSPREPKEAPTADTGNTAAVPPAQPVTVVLPRPEKQEPAMRRLSDSATKKGKTPNGPAATTPSKQLSSPPPSKTTQLVVLKPKTAPNKAAVATTAPLPTRDRVSAPSLKPQKSVDSTPNTVSAAPPVLVTLPRTKPGAPSAGASAFPSAPAAVPVAEKSPRPPTGAAGSPATAVTGPKPRRTVERVLSRPTPPSQPPSGPSSAKRTPATAVAPPSSRQAPPAQATPRASPRRRRQPNRRRGSTSVSQSSPDASPTASSALDKRANDPAPPATGGATMAHDPVLVQRARQANQDRLTSFVKSVSDPEVLHVVYDYLVEHKGREMRYQDAINTCRELLSQKEQLLDVKDRNSSRRQVGVEVESPVYLAPGLEAFRGDPNLAAALAALADGEDEEDEDLLDEFDDLNTNDHPYPHTTQFRFGEPTVSGTVSKVFAEGMLYKIKDERGAFHFFNDTTRQVMMVRLRIKLTGEETTGPQVMVTDLADGSGQKEVTAVVLPEETKFFMSGVSRLPRVMAKAVLAPDDFVPPSVTKSMKQVASEIEAVRSAMGKWGKASNQKDYLKCCLKNNLRFTDLQFRPSAESLFRPSCDLVKIMPLTWRRPQDYLFFTEVSEARLFRGQISCHLVKQGELNDHTVVAGMAAIAQHPQHVEWLFRHPVSAALGKMERARGAYSVRVLQNGWWTTFLLDDYLPASMKGPLFARDPTDPRRLWVSLLEKAYAKSLGSYASLCLCDIMMVLSDFTGYPVRYLDDRWAQAQLKPTAHASISLFKFMERCTSRKHLIVLFTPSPQEESDETQVLHRKRSERFIPVNGVMPQFLPGRIYFLTETAFYEALDLRMVRLKNPWTWESAGASELEKHWKYTSWYDQPEASMSLASATTRLASAMGDTKAAAKDDGRRATMWMEWGEALKSFAGGGVCYAMWDWTQYRIKNQFSAGVPGHVVELNVLTKVQGFVTLTLEGVKTALDADGNVVDTTRQSETLGVALAISQHNEATKQEEVVGRSCDDPESFAVRPTYVQARDVSMRFIFDPAHSPYYIIPMIDPSSVEVMRTQGKSVLPFVVSLVLDTPCVAGKMEVRFKKLKPTCPVFSNESPFSLGAYSTVKAAYQCTGHDGVVEGESSMLNDGLQKNE